MSRVIVFALSKMSTDWDHVTVPFNNAPTNHNVILGDSNFSDTIKWLQEFQARQAVYV